MTEVTASIEIDRPANVVFDFLADMENNPKWQKGQQYCEWTSEPPLKLGSTYDQRARFLGKEIISSFEVVEYESGRRIRIKTTSGTMPIDVTREVTPRSEQHCEVTALIKGDPPRLLRLLGPFLNTMVRSSVNKDYQRLKSILEAMPEG